MPLTFPAHQGLILPAANKWPNHIDALALSVGAAMPDIIESTVGILFNGYFTHWYGHSLVGVFTIDLLGGLLITWMIIVSVAGLLKYALLPQRLQALFTNTPPKNETAAERNSVHGWQKLGLWSFSVTVGVLSHLAFDLISHDTNLLLYPWYNDLQWFPAWWYTTWFEIPALPIFGHSYAVGSFTVMWVILTTIGIISFFRFFSPMFKNKI